MNEIFSEFSTQLVGLPVSRVWRGYGSALFLEFGKLEPRPPRRDGSRGGDQGQMSLMIQWSWRIEGRRTILGGSWSEEHGWRRLFRLLEGATVRSVALFGHLPEIEVLLSNDVRVISFQTTSGDPQWTLFNRSSGHVRWIHTKLGVVQYEAKQRGRD